MPAPSLIDAACGAPDRWQRIKAMAVFMRDMKNGPSGACTEDDLIAGGFDRGERAANHEPALRMLSERPYLYGTQPKGRMVGVGLVMRAKEIRARPRPPVWTAPAVTPTPAAASAPLWSAPVLMEADR